MGHGEGLEVLARAEDRLQRVGAVVIVADRRPVLGEEEKSAGISKRQKIRIVFMSLNKQLFACPA